MNEIWKDIKGLEGIYQISNFGRLKSLERFVKNRNGVRKVKEKILKPHIGTCGYYQYPLKINGKTKTILIHRLVAETFIPNEYKLPCINHKDENRLNNFVCINEDGTIDYKKSNLEWCDVSYNNNYNGRKEREIEMQRKNKNRNKSVKQYTINGEIVAEYISCREAERITNISHSNISDCLKGKRKSAGGYLWLVSN